MVKVGSAGRIGERRWRGHTAVVNIWWHCIGWVDVMVRPSLLAHPSTLVG